MKKAVLTFLLICGATLIYGQKVKFKKDKVVADKVELLRFEKVPPRTVHAYNFFDLENDLLVMKFRHETNGTMQDLSDDYTEVNFLNAGVTMQVRGGNPMKILELMVKSNVLGMDGKIHNEKIEGFEMKYDID